MKTLIALAAAAALAGGVSVASAQSTTQKNMNNMKTTGSAAFCAQNAKSNSMDCKFASMAACEKENKAKGEGANCIQNPKSATTGAASGSGMNKTDTKKQ